jgi:hypothetical protein
MISGVARVSLSRGAAGTIGTQADDRRGTAMQALLQRQFIDHPILSARVSLPSASRASWVFSSWLWPAFAPSPA